MSAFFTGPAIRTYGVQAAARAPLLHFMVRALQLRGCRIIHVSSPTTAPFIITFETLSGERLGIVCYAFLATRTPTKNRPADERSFQIKYGSKESYGGDNTHELWRDPFGLYTTLFIGIDPDAGFFIAPDPAMHSPTKFFIRFEFKDRHVEQIKSAGWCAWERERRGASADKTQDEDEGGPVEVVVGGTAEHFLDLILFERAAEGLDQGNRQLLSEKRHLFAGLTTRRSDDGPSLVDLANHPLLSELSLGASEVLDLITSARRLKMAVRGWVAEEHLRTTLSKVPGVSDCVRLDGDGGPDLSIRFRGGAPFSIECKNVLRVPDRLGRPRVDFQRTRASKADPCSRYYQSTDFDILAACLHARTEAWEFTYVPTFTLPPHKKCPGRIASGLVIDDLWSSDATILFAQMNEKRG